MNGEALARLWKDPDGREWPDEDHPAGQIYLHLSTPAGLAGSAMSIDTDTSISTSVSVTLGL